MMSLLHCPQKQNQVLQGASAHHKASDASRTTKYIVYLKYRKMDSLEVCIETVSVSYWTQVPDSRLGLLSPYFPHICCSDPSEGCVLEHMSNTWEQTPMGDLASFVTGQLKDKRRPNCKVVRPKKPDIPGNKQAFR